MKNSLLVTSLVAAVFGCAGAGLMLLIGSGGGFADASAPTAATPGGARASTQGFDSLSDELSTLALENRELRTRIEALERRPIADTRSAVATSNDAGAMKAVGDGLEASDESMAIVHPIALQASVEQALEMIRANERAEAERAREARELERMEERLTRMTEQLALTPAQVNDMRAHMLAQDAARDELDRQRDTGIDRETYRTLRDEQRERERTALARILDAEQLKTLTTRDEDRGNERGRNSNRQRAGGQRGG